MMVTRVRISQWDAANDEEALPLADDGVHHLPCGGSFDLALRQRELGGIPVGDTGIKWDPS